MIAQPTFRLTEFNGTQFRRHPDFHLRPARDQGNEYTVIIGPNGTGKSALLGSLAHGTKSPSQAKRPSPSCTIAIANLVTDNFPLHRAPGSEPYHYFGLRQGTNTVTTGALSAVSLAAILALPSSTVPKYDWRSLCEELRMPTPNLFARRVEDRSRERPAKPDEGSARKAADARLFEVFEGGEVFARDSLKSTMKSGALNFSDIGSLLCEVMEDFSNTFDASALLKRLPRAIGWRLHLDYPQYPERNESHRKPSVGQEMLFSQLTRAASAARPRALLLIDEPETGQHPQWQANFIPLLREAIPDYLGMHIILATHSPFIVGAADSVVSATERGFEQVQTNFSALSIDTISYRIFGTTTTGSVLVEQDISLVLQYLSDARNRRLPPREVVAATERLRSRKTQETSVLTVVLDEFDEIVTNLSKRSI